MIELGLSEYRASYSSVLAMETVHIAGPMARIHCIFVSGLATAAGIRCGRLRLRI